VAEESEHHIEERLLKANEFKKRSIDTRDRIIYEVDMVDGS
jgi:hypothetical protein